MSDEQPQWLDPIPETVDEALARWDAGETVFTVEMGGLGPGYEQAIQILAFELMREFRRFNLNDEDECKRAEVVRDEVVRRIDKQIGGFSGAQVGAASNLASCVCRRGYRNAMRDDAVKDRLIQVERRMPQLT